MADEQIQGIFGNAPDDNSPDDEEIVDDEPEGGEQPEGDEGDEGSAAGEQAADPGGQPPDGGQQLILGKFRSHQDLEQGYQQLERNMHGQGQQVSQLRGQLERATQWIQAVQPQLQRLQGQGQGQNPQAGGPAAAPEFKFDGSFDRYIENPDQFGADLKQSVEAYTAARVDQAIQQAAQQLGVNFNQVMAPVQQFMASQQTGQRFVGDVQNLSSAYPDFDEYRGDMSQMLDNPQYASWLDAPDGMERLYKEAKFNRMLAQNQQQPGAAPNNQRAQQKRAARMPQGGTRRVAQTQDEDEAVLDQIYGPADQKQGIFG